MRKRCQKNIYLGVAVLEISAASAVIKFNDGKVGMFRVLVRLGIIPGSNCIDYCKQIEQAKIYQINRKELNSVKH